MEAKRKTKVFLSAPENFPGSWKITGFLSDGSRLWTILRKPDGSFWEVKAEHLFPPEGGTLKVELGQQITNQATVSHFEATFIDLQEKRCRCGHPLKAHNPTTSRCDGDDEFHVLPVVEEGQPYPPMPQCKCVGFDPRND